MPIIKIEVSEPTDTNNPFPREIVTDFSILYHGTSTIWMDVIESNGFVTGQWPINIKNVMKIIELYEKMGWCGINDDGYNVLRFYSVGRDNEKAKNKSSSFTPAYRRARNYASNSGGETIKAMLIAITDLETYIADGKERKRHERGIKESHSNSKYYLDILKDKNMLNNEIKELLKMKIEYEQLLEGNKPVVYAIKTTLAKKEFSINTGFDIRVNRAIKASDIIGRVDFPNGVERIIPYVNNEEMALREFWDKLKSSYG